MSKKKITEIYLPRMVGKEYRDENGNLKVKQVKGKVRRSVIVVTAGRRFLHYLVDSIFIIIIGLIVSLILYQQFGFLLPIQYRTYPGGFNFHIDLSFYTVTFAYYAFFEFLIQRTPGKVITNTWVIDEYGNKPSISAIILRSLIRFIPFEPFTCFGERGWHDRWSNTFVVTKDELNTLHELLSRAEENELGELTKQPSEREKPFE